MRRTILFVVALMFASVLQSVNQQSYAIAQGEECSAINTSRKVGKTQFKCLGIEGMSFWIQLENTIPNTKLLAKTVTQLNKTVEAITFEPFTSDAEIELATADLSIIDKNVEMIEINLPQARAKAEKYVELTSSLLTSTQKLTSDATILKSDNDRKLENYQSAQTKTNSYYPQYQAALNSRTANVSCAVLKDFGFVGSCVVNPFQDALDVQTIRNYNSLLAASEAALVEFRAANAAWRASLATASKELEKLQIAQDSSELMKLRVEEWENLSGIVTKQVQYVQEFIDQAKAGIELTEKLEQARKEALTSIKSVLSSSKTKLAANYQRAQSLVQYLKLSSGSYSDRIAQKEEYSQLQIVVTEPNIWKPSKYFQASLYPNIENLSGIDFGWAWSSNKACETWSKCEKVYLAANKNCNRTLLTLDFMTEGKVSEAKSTSKEFSLVAGEIMVVEIESKYTETAKNSYVRALNCLAP